MLEIKPDGSYHFSFDSVREWLALVKDSPWIDQPRDWVGMSRLDAIDRARFGQDSLVSKAEEMLALVSLPETHDYTYQPSVVGAFPCIPDVLTGFPEPMRHREINASESVPIRIFANVFLSQGISLNDGLKRGVAIAALVMRLQETHPIELKLVVSHCKMYNNSFGPEDTLITVNVGILPIDLSVLAFLLANPACYRSLMLCTNGSKDYRHTYPATASATKQALGITDRDLYIHSLVFGDKLTSEPLAWINEQVEYFNGLEN